MNISWLGLKTPRGISIRKPTLNLIPVTNKDIIVYWFINQVPVRDSLINRFLVKQELLLTDKEGSKPTILS